VRDHLSALRHGSLAAYGATFRDLTRWSLAGVVLTEVTVNAHAYLVTLPGRARAFRASWRWASC
jgi:hypothetical protein